MESVSDDQKYIIHDNYPIKVQLINKLIIDQTNTEYTILNFKPNDDKEILNSPILNIKSIKCDCDTFEKLDYLDLILHNSNPQYSFSLLELILHYDMYDALDIYINKCILITMKFHDNVLRIDENAGRVFTRIVELYLDKIFDENFDVTNLIGSLFVICSNAPRILRKICLAIFNAGTKIDDCLGYRTVCAIIIFRYFVGKVMMRNMTNPNVLIECKKIQSMANFNNSSNHMMMSLVRILIADDIGSDFTLKLCDSVVNNHCENLMEFCILILPENTEVADICKLIERDIKSCQSTHIIQSSQSSQSSQSYQSSKSTQQSYPSHSLQAIKVKRIHKSNSVKQISKHAYKKDSSNESLPKNTSDDKLTSISLSMSIESVKHLLHTIELDMYDDIIDLNGITSHVFIELTIDKMKMIGITNKVHQKNIYKLIKKQKKRDSAMTI